MAEALRTEAVDPADSIDFWTAAVSRTYVDLDCAVPEDASTISGHIESTDLATLGLSRVTATAQSVLRTPAGISRTSADYFLVSVQTAGTGIIAQDDRTAILEPGDFALYDSTRPYSLQFDDPFAQYVLMLPGSTLRTLVRDTGSLTARAVSGRQGAGKLLVSMISSIMDDVDMSAASAEAVSQSVEYILVAGLVGLTGVEKPAPYAASQRLEEIKRAMTAGLRDPDLTVAGVASTLHLSLSTVHRAFAGEPCTASEWIWMQRLDGVKRALCDPLNGRTTIGALAAGWGFTDPAHFSRAFRARFGCTPREFREGRPPR
nr:helix-turn-helix domain-containing protein [Rhodococcus sp. (in: high G+C Gram-positive bacteria)]